uniref:Phytocyanin domain-containing protein n=1 Tax=Cannabis sativa TaxID=3483 RepID=A0A803QJZ7_CANSA
MAMQTFLLSLAVMAAMLIQLTMGETYTVGGSGGWEQTSDLQTWGSSQTFSVGDSLSFQYTPNHNVIEVPKADYDVCGTTNLIQIYNDGSTIIPLTSPGKRYFICGTSGHCSGGMKLEITTLAAATPSSLPPSSNTPTPKPSSPPSPPGPVADNSPEAEPTAAPPLSPYSSMEDGSPLSLTPIAPSTSAHLSAPAPSAAPVIFATNFRSGLLMGFGALLLAF